MSGPMQTPDSLNWNPASVQLPEIPMLPPGDDAMSMTIAGVLPTLAASMATSVTALQAKETMFAGKVGSAQSAYDNADDQGGQSLGQFGQMLGQLGQMAQQAGGPAQQLGQQAGQFGQMIQQAMGSAQGGGGATGPQGGSAQPAGAQPAGGQPAAGQGAGGTGAAAPQQSRDDAASDRDRSQEERERAEHDEREREREARAARPPLDHAVAGPAPHATGPAPVAPPQRGEGLERNM
ncbi:hypothetical protein H7K45_00235 [Mycobacterium yunnanensis]|uniref:PE family protein n=1 Tax=Mycobacterium yunnanensis TaxID=368477 RepID=A0A9X2YGU5_9MYCO|nr:hypothetical protein [Mycobacterium yunnanensis]MCV7418962.1 hypothetical protein [Mycobacterium yunnanensis]